jgi:integrase/recombinase XerD
MSENLHRKLNRTKKGNRTRKALSVAEVKRLLAWLEKDSSAMGQRDYAIVFMLVTSGLRSAELGQLRWKDLEYFEGTWTARFIGKGNREAEQELYTESVEACRRYFKNQFKREPKPEDALFWTFSTYRGEKNRPLAYHTLWRRIKDIGQAAREQGIITRDLIWSPHLFRRSYATALYKSGMGIKAIQEKTRHTNIDVLVRHYIHDEELASPYFEKMLG